MDSKEEDKNKKDVIQRSVGLDLLRIFAALMIVVQHVSSLGLGSFSVAETGWKASNFYCAMVRWAVPIFFVISGHLFLNRKGEFSVAKIFKKNLLKLVIIYFVWLVFYAAMDYNASGMAASEGLHVLDKAHAILTAALTNSKYHLWFLPSIIGCYLLLPLFHAVAEYEDGKYLSYACILFIVFGVGVSTLFPYENSLLSIAVHRIGYPLAGYQSYFLLGGYLGRIDTTKYHIRYLAPIIIGLLAFQISVTEYLSVKTGIWNGLWYGEFSLPTFIEVVCFFLIAIKANLSQLRGHWKKLIAVTAECTLGVYLMHIYLLEHMYRLNIYSFTQWISIPLVSVVIFMVCMCITWGLKKIPFIGKWIV